MNRPCIVGTLLVLVHFTAGNAQEPAPAARPENWAQPIEAAGVENLFQVSDRLYRCAQPTAEGMKSLKELGIETVVNLRSFHSDRDLMGETGLGYEHIYMKAWHPEEEEVVRFLQIVTNPKRTPVVVHCQRGADRTGLMCAIYRVAVQNWPKEEAIREMIEGGYSFNPAWQNLIQWIRDLDIEAIAKRAGLRENPNDGI